MTPEYSSQQRCLDEDDILDAAYDIFLSMAPDNLDPADQLLFNLQFEDRGAAELYVPDEIFWSRFLSNECCLQEEAFAEVIIGLTDEQGMINDIFARLLLSRDPEHKTCEIIWKV